MNCKHELVACWCTSRPQLQRRALISDPEPVMDIDLEARPQQCFTASNCFHLEHDVK